MNSADILKNHRQHFVTRLISRNPLLKFLPNAYREDITNLVKSETLEIEKQIQPLEILKNLLSESPKLVKIQNVQKKNLAKCTKIKNAADDYVHSTGQLSFYLGFPFVHVPLESKGFQFAPLFLWAITCKITASAITFERISDDDGNPLEPQLNRILNTWLNYETGIHLNWDNAENLTFDTVIEETQLALNAWSKCNSILDLKNIQPIPDTEILKSLGKAQVFSCAVLGYVPFKGQALLDDLDKLSEQLQGESNNGILDYFLKPIKSTSAEKNAPRPKDSDQWLVTDYDHSQESVVWNTRKFDLMVLQGPPGTGKSQVIVNLIADAIANKKKVLVVCQKKAALDVIRKRLEANGLGDLVQLIEDPQSDRMRIIKSIRDIADDFSNDTELVSVRNKVSDMLVDYETFLDKTNELLSENQYGKQPNYGNLKARLYQLAQEGIDAYGNLNELYEKTVQSSEWLPDTLQDLRTLLLETSEFLQEYRGCNYADNPYRHLEKIPDNQPELRGIINQISTLAQSLEHSDSDFYSSQTAWLAEHDWAINSYIDFLSPENRQAYEAFRHLSHDTHKLNKWFPANYTDALLTAVCNNKKIDGYSRLKEFSGTVERVLFVKNKLNEQAALHFLCQYLPEKIDHWQKIIECFRFQSWLDELSKQGIVSKFEFEARKKKLQQSLQEKRHHDVADIRAKYAQRLRARNNLTDLNLLRLKKSSNAPKTSLRKLYTAGFDLIHELYPVLLTNPEGVSAILELSPNLYDLVIIDEASQMFMADALPILYRAKAVFLSGDSQQMPPSDFFVSLDDIENTDDEESDEEENVDKNRLIAADGEYCLLDAAEYAVKKGTPNHAMLSVHYRSEFKELIDFSNHAFYDGKLIAAVSNKICPSVIKSPIELNVVENASANAAVNPTEAHAVVERIATIWKQQNTLSMGVIALNVKQKDQIDDLLFEKSQQDSEFLARLEQERNRTKDGEDVGFFVRSVEHVQGDERDLIILSTVYDGTRRNFGAISRKEKGRKRLNVAVTRAKLGMIIYTSLNIDAISNESQRDVSESYWFWQYMRYARAISENNKQMTETILNSLSGKSSQSSTDAEPDSFFEEDVSDFLRAQNYHVDYQIGESGFRIDLGVKRNLEDSLYLCGIECDGRQYHSSWSARLNDVWRQNILENKGWKIVRIWSNDWFDNRTETQAKLLADLNAL